MGTRQRGLPTALSPCGQGNDIVYAWAQDAPELKLPEGVGFRVGGDTGIEWLVLQVHYATVKYIDREVGDDTGVDLVYTNVEQPRSAGVLFLGTNGRIPAKTTTKMESACEIKEDVRLLKKPRIGIMPDLITCQPLALVRLQKVIHPFAFRVHTHSLGQVVSGWKVKNKHEWKLLGKENPQLPQMFYPIQAEEGTTLTRGETIASRCTMNNWKDQAVWVGATREDEMCNFYLMYWVNGKDILKQKRCGSMGPPLYSWGNWIWPFGAGLSNIPDEEASKL